MKKILLASASPRRYELLQKLNIQFKVKPSSIEENIQGNLKPYQTACLLAKKKAIDVSKKEKDAVVIGADTIVVYRNGILGKPKDEDDAIKMLKKLSGTTHQVITGICVVDANTLKKVAGFEKTHVKMRNLTDQEILNYVKTKEPMDKAGGYGIQGKGGLLVEKIDGCYFNVVGLPLGKLYEVLKEFDISLL